MSENQPEVAQEPPEDAELATWTKRYPRYNGAVDKNSLPSALMTRGVAKGKITDTVRIWSTDEAGTPTYICNVLPDCGYTHTNMSSMLPHIAQHVHRGDIESKSAAVRARKAAGSRLGRHKTTTTSLDDRVNAVVDAVEDTLLLVRGLQSEYLASLKNAEHDLVPADWKDRATRAERQLKNLQRAFKSIAGDD